MRFIGNGRPETIDEARSRIAEYCDEQRVRGWSALCQLPDELPTTVTVHSGVVNRQRCWRFPRP
jgi:hypothetical protein